MYRWVKHVTRGFFGTFRSRHPIVQYRPFAPKCMYHRQRLGQITTLFNYVHVHVLSFNPMLQYSEVKYGQTRITHVHVGIQRTKYKYINDIV